MDLDGLPQGRDDCPRCAALAARVRELERRLADLEDRLRANSSNSSNAPSTDRPWEPRYPKKTPTGRSPGGQKGHRGFGRPLLPPDQVDRVVEHRAATCDRCGAALPSDAPGEVTGRRQVAELPPRAVVVTEHRSLACACPRCGRSVRGTIPPAVRASCTGPRLTAALCYVSARVHGARRAVAELLGDVLGCPLSLGGVVNKEAEVAAALEPGYARARGHVRDAPAKNVDETGWELAGTPYWLWAAATPDAAVFRVDRCRTFAALQRLAGDDDRGLIAGTLCTDRFGAYNYLKVRDHALCWAHLTRDFRRFADRGGGTKRLGDEGLAVAAEVFRLFGRVRDGAMGRAQLRRRLAPVRRRLRDLLDWALGTGVSKAVHFAGNLLRRWDALWTFARVEGVEPTNNHAERVLRPAVVWRKTSFGCAGEGGCRFVERMLTAVQTCRLQGRSVLDYLAETLHAHRHGLPTPALV